MGADWIAMRAEYITTDTSYRKLAEKYGLNQATIAQKAKAEDWVGKRKQQASTAQALILENDINSKVDRASRLMSVADKLLNKVEQVVDQEGPISASAIKNLSDALKNIRETQMIRSEMDTLEQEARIESLKRKNEADNNTANEVVVRFMAGEEEWNE